jgi:hypothetical protein
MRQRVRNFWAGTNPAQKISLVLGTATLVAVLQLGTADAPVAPFSCTNPAFGHTIAIAGDDSDTPKELAAKYCKGNLIAAADALATETRYTTDTIFHGAIVRLPNSK